MHKIAIVGSRTYPKLDDIKKYLDAIPFDTEEYQDTKIITGGAPGVDKAAEAWAKANNVKCEVIRPINPSDKFSYLLRNVEIITKADRVVVFWDRISRGSKFVIDYCKARNKSLEVIKYKPLEIINVKEVKQ